MGKAEDIRFGFLHCQLSHEAYKKEKLFLKHKPIFMN